MGRLLGAVVVVGVLAPGLAGCVPPVPDPVVTTTVDPGDAAVLQARAVIGDPVLAVADPLLELGGRLDAIRHEVPRGAAQQAAVEALRVDLATLAQAGEALRDVADGLRTPDLADDRVAAAADAAGSLAELAAEAVEEAAADLDALAPLLADDLALDAIVAAWDDRGSRSQRLEALTALVEVADAQVAATRRLDVPACVDLRTDRIRWAELVAARTRELRDAVAGREGTRFDELRERFQRAPYGEDRAVADSESRVCWAAGEPFGDLAAAATDLVADIDRALGS